MGFPGWPQVWMVMNISWMDLSNKWCACKIIKNPLLHHPNIFFWFQPWKNAPAVTTVRPCGRGLGAHQGRRHYRRRGREFRGLGWSWAVFRHASGAGKWSLAKQTRCQLATCQKLLVWIPSILVLPCISWWNCERSDVGNTPRRCPRAPQPSPRTGIHSFLDKRYPSFLFRPRLCVMAGRSGGCYITIDVGKYHRFFLTAGADFCFCEH